MTATSRRYGLTYARELYLAAGGDDMRGEDRLTGRSDVPFAVRFHLHPSVAASLAAGGSGAVLRLPGGTVWRLRAVGAEMSLADSVYLGSGEVRPTRQIVLSGTTGRDGATCAGRSGASRYHPMLKRGCPRRRRRRRPKPSFRSDPPIRRNPRQLNPRGHRAASRETAQKRRSRSKSASPPRVPMAGRSVKRSNPRRNRRYRVRLYW